MADNPPCPKCGGRTTKGGKMRSGNQRYYCRSCKYYFSPVNVGRVPIADRPMTGAERQRRYRAKKKGKKKIQKVVDKVTESVYSRDMLRKRSPQAKNLKRVKKGRQPINKGKNHE